MAGASIDIGVVMHGFGVANETLGVLQQSFDRFKDALESQVSTTGTLNDVQQQNIRRNRELARSYQDLRRTVLTFGTEALRDVTRELINSARQMETYGVLLRTVNGSAELAAAQLDRLKEAAKLPGMNLDGLVRGTSQLQAAGIQAETAEKLVMGLGNALASVGGETSELHGLTRAFTQIQAKGKVFAEEIQQIAERLPQIRVLMQDSFGTANTENIQRMGLMASEFNEIMADALDSLPKAARTTNTSIKNLNESFRNLKASLGKALLKPLTEFLDGITFLVDKFNALPDPIKEATGSLVGFASVMGTLILTLEVLLPMLGTLGALTGAGSLGKLATKHPMLMKIALLGGATYFAGKHGGAALEGFLNEEYKKRGIDPIGSQGKAGGSGGSAKSKKPIISPQLNNRIFYGTYLSSQELGLKGQASLLKIPKLSEQRINLQSNPQAAIQEAYYQAVNSANQAEVQRKLEFVSLLNEIKESPGGGNKNVFRDLWEVITEDDNRTINWTKAFNPELLSLVSELIRQGHNVRGTDELTKADIEKIGKYGFSATQQDIYAATVSVPNATNPDGTPRKLDTTLFNNPRAEGLASQIDSFSEGIVNHQNYIQSIINDAEQKKDISVKAITDQISIGNLEAARKIAETTLFGNVRDVELARIDMLLAQGDRDRAYSSFALTHPGVNINESEEGRALIQEQDASVQAAIKGYDQARATKSFEDTSSLLSVSRQGALDNRLHQIEMESTLYPTGITDPYEELNQNIAQIDAKATSRVEELEQSLQEPNLSDIDRQEIQDNITNIRTQSLNDQQIARREYQKDELARERDIRTRGATLQGNQILRDDASRFSFTQTGAEDRRIRGEAQLEKSLLALDYKDRPQDETTRAEFNVRMNEIQAKELAALDNLYGQTYRNIALKVSESIQSMINSVRGLFKSQKEARNNFADTIQDMNLDLSNNIRDIYQDETLTYQDKEIKKLEILQEYNKQREEAEKDHAEAMKKIQQEMLDAFKEAIIQNATETALLKSGEFITSKLPKGSKASEWIAGIFGGSDAIENLKSLADYSSPQTPVTTQTIANAVKVGGDVANLVPSDPPSNPIATPPVIPNYSSIVPTNTTSTSSQTFGYGNMAKNLGAISSSGLTSYMLGQSLVEEDTATSRVLQGLLGVAGIGASFIPGVGAFAPWLMGAGIGQIGSALFDSPSNDIILQSMAKKAGQTQRSAEDMSRLVVQGFKEGYSDQAEVGGNTSVNITGHFELGHRELQYIADETTILKKRGIIG